MKKVILYLIIIFLYSGCDINASSKDNLPELAFVKTSDSDIQINYSSKKNNYFLVVRTASANQETPLFIEKYNLDTNYINIGHSESKKNGNFLVKYLPKGENISFTLTGLTPAMKYAFDLYNEIPEENSSKNESDSVHNDVKYSSITFYHSTFPTKPSEPASYIGFYTSEANNSVAIRFNKGNGTGRIAIASLNENIPIPVDGVLYTASQNFSDAKSKINDKAYVVWDSQGSNDFQFEIFNLPNIDVYLKIYEYNLVNNLISYNIQDSTSNPRVVRGNLQKPIALTPEFSTGNMMNARWEAVDGVNYYELQVAIDSDFKNIYKHYNDLDTDTLNNWFIEVEPELSKLYYRVRAVSKGNKSAYSNVIEVKF